MAEIPPEEQTAPMDPGAAAAVFSDPAPGWDRYAVVDYVGEGSMGVVFRAIDRSLQRTVALKFLRSDDPAESARFQREARAQARIGHEHVCRVFETGEVNGRAYLAMRFIEGETLPDLMTRLDVEQKVEILERVARAVQAGHDIGVIHRDLKPGNIMVETRPGGSFHPYVLDFGLAADAAEISAGDAVAAVGTPAFMAPEQVRGGSSVLDRRTDVYGLGATLYAVLAEQAPFFAVTREATMRQVLDHEPPRLGLVVPGTARDLETIVGASMAKDPERRYPSAGAFADDLRRFLDGEPIVARPASVAYRVRTWLRTRGLGTALLAALVMVAVAVPGFVLRQRFREQRREVVSQRFQHEVERMDRSLRGSRMMPLHDTTHAEQAVREQLKSIEESLSDDGSLARGPAYFALGLGHLLLHEQGPAERWLEAAWDVGYRTPSVDSALGVAMATGILSRRDDGDADDDRRRLAIRHLAGRGPATEDSDLFHRAFGLYLEGRTDAALAAARASSRRTPWLYEAAVLEADILVLRSAERERDGDLEGAVADLREAGEVYARTLEIARSDSWVYEGDARRLLRILRTSVRRGEFPSEIFDLAVARAAAAESARPGRATPLMIMAAAHLLQAEHLGRTGGDPGRSLADAVRLAGEAAAIEPDNPEVAELVSAARRQQAESRGSATG